MSLPSLTRLFVSLADCGKIPFLRRVLVYAGPPGGNNHGREAARDIRNGVDGYADTFGGKWSMRPNARHRWKFLTREVSIRTVLRAMIPMSAWIVFLVLIASAYRAVVHVEGPAAIALGILRALIEIVTLVIAFKYFFEILERGAAEDLATNPKDRA